MRKHFAVRSLRASARVIAEYRIPGLVYSIPLARLREWPIVAPLRAVGQHPQRMTSRFHMN